jgi:acetyl esterase/lipase
VQSVKTLSLIFCVLVAGAAVQAQQLEDPAWIKDLAPKRIVYSVRGMERIKPIRDLVYKRVGSSNLKMDVYPPRGSRLVRAPIVMFVHGGRVPANLRTPPKDWGVYISFGQLAAASGFVGVTFNHRFHQWESLSDSESDITAAIMYVRENAARFGADPDRVVLWAVSAGGIFFSQPLRDRPEFIRALVGYYPELNLQASRQSAPPSVSDETLRRFSPVTYLTDGKTIPPIFLARAGLDDPELNAGVDLFVKLALEKNLTVELMNHPTGHHGFDIEDNNNRSREILKRTIEFIREHTR